MMHAISQQVKKGLGQIRQVFQGIVARGGSDVLQLTGYADETLQEIELFQQVGFSSHIPKGARVVVIPLQGKTAKSIVVATTAGKVVINVESGETCIYDQFGHSVWLKQDGTHVAGDLFVDGNISSTGEVSDQKSSMQEMRDIYNGHKHGNTSVPNEQM
ncbi:phage baseplate assembly protein [Acinetobacter ursingii]|uniref:phage baseplate assembly protein domain-containing protein n=1 Tax=Acinetobacter ursingii TaxID=108980 RepID=UPI0021CDAA19|nr:phage baseplate assembly protein [Acinetobacter ursingii]MCU4307014.1 phage baseplate assembly protein [Acinetobacter ursingii]MCU4373231.1 phage baseplate assembly protein [Acinetobacter ursingii]